MGKYIFTAQYSIGSWARMARSSDHRTAADGGSVVIVELPDSVSARTVANTAFKTGAFTSVKAQELLTQDQLSDTLTLTQSAQQAYEAPGKAAVELG